MGQRDEAEMGCGSRSLIHLLLVQNREAALGRTLVVRFEVASHSR
jgi:hypothetical protein